MFIGFIPITLLRHDSIVPFQFSITPGFRAQIGYLSWKGLAVAIFSF
jgi:hypothetical protein